MAKTYNIYGMGNALVDIVTEVDEEFFAQQQIEKGVMTLVDEERQKVLVAAIDLPNAEKQCGGSAANTVIGASQLGARCYYSCKVADDDMGRFYIGDLAANGVDSNLSADALDPGITGKCLVMTTPDTERTMNTFLGITATYSSDQIDDEALRDSEYIYIEGYLVTGDASRQAMVEAKRIAEQSGVKTALTFSDPSMVKYFREQMEEVVGDGVDLLFCNEEEAQLFTDTDSPEEAKEALKAMARAFVMTLGPKGAIAFDGKEEHFIEPVPAKAVDTNGAGDLFAGGFLYGLTHGLSFSEAGRLASHLASAVVSKFGPRLTKPQCQEILARVRG